jgi:hypothetical protein
VLAFWWWEFRRVIIPAGRFWSSGFWEPLWSPDGAEVILKLRAVVINGDLDDYMNYYKAPTATTST